jgi:hypothetical protein
MTQLYAFTALASALAAAPAQPAGHGTWDGKAA